MAHQRRIMALVWQSKQQRGGVPPQLLLLYVIYYISHSIGGNSMANSGENRKSKLAARQRNQRRIA